LGACRKTGEQSENVYENKRPGRESIPEFILSGHGPAAPPMVMKASVILTLSGANGLRMTGATDHGQRTTDKPVLTFCLWMTFR
jgi:hypothetical protein